MVLSAEEGARIASTLAHHKAVILRNHGLLTAGPTVDAAVWWFITMERSCQVQLAAESVGHPIPISPEVAASTAEIVATAYDGWLNFQPLYDAIVHEQPDLLN